MSDEKSTELLAGIAARRSCRAFENTPPAPELLASVLKYATFSPSAKNAQPWEVYVVAGERLDALRAKMDEAFHQGRGVPMHAGREMPAWQARARELNGALAPVLERQGWEPKSFIGRCLRFFDAPAAAIVCMDGEPSPLHLLDIGMFTQTLCLSAAGHGLASCIIAYTLIVEPVIREFLRLPAERRVMITVALGFPAKDQPMAQFRSGRAEAGENVHFV